MSNWFNKFSSWVEVNKDPMGFDSRTDSLQSVFNNNKNTEKIKYRKKRIYQMRINAPMTNKELDREE